MFDSRKQPDRGRGWGFPQSPAYQRAGKAWDLPPPRSFFLPPASAASAPVGELAAVLGLLVKRLVPPPVLPPARRWRELQGRPPHEETRATASSLPACGPSRSPPRRGSGHRGVQTAYGAPPPCHRGYGPSRKQSFPGMAGGRKWCPVNVL